MMAAQPRHLHRLLAFFAPLLRRASLVVETDHSPTVRLQVGHDYSDSGGTPPQIGTPPSPPPAAPSSNSPLGRESLCTRPRVYDWAFPIGRVHNSALSPPRRPV